MATSWLFLLLLLQFTETTMGQPDYTTVRIGADVTLPCKNLIRRQNNCDVSWFFSDRADTALAVNLAQRGQITRRAGRKSDRLSVTQDCSLVIKEVKEEDAGRYDCRQIRPGQQFQDSTVFLSVVKIFPSAPVNEDYSAEDVTLRCFVSINDRCTHTVRWLFQGRAVDRTNREQRFPCSASFTFPAYDFSFTSRYNSFTCEVTDRLTGTVQLFPVSPQTSGEAPGENTTSATAELVTTSEDKEAAGTNNAPLELSECAGWSSLDYVVLALRVAELVLMTVITALLLRGRGCQGSSDGNKVNANEDGADAAVNYENVGEPSVSVRM